MSLGADTVVVNGERVNVPPMAAYTPQGYGPQTVGVPNITPSYPPYLGAPTSLAPGAESVGGYGTAGNNAMVTQIAHDHPFNWRVSPVVWVAVGLLGSLVLLKSTTFRESVVEAHEGFDLGGAGEEGSAHA